MEFTEVIHNWAARCWTAAWSPGMAAGEDNSEKGEKGQADKADAGDLTSAQKKAAEDRLMTVSTRAREIRELQERVNCASIRLNIWAGTARVSGGGHQAVDVLQNCHCASTRSEPAQAIRGDCS